MQRTILAATLAATFGLAACDRAPTTPPSQASVNTTGSSEAAQTANANASGPRIDAPPRTTPSSPGNVDAPALPASGDVSRRQENAETRVDPGTGSSVERPAERSATSPSSSANGNAAERAADRTGAAVDRAGSATRNAAESAGDKARDAIASAGRAIDDGAVTARVKAALMAADDVPSTAINVDTSRGRVTLTGRVSNQQQKDRAVQATRRVEGVQSVDDRRLAVGG